MTSYLHNLVARSLGLIETAQPRVASLFEPPRPAAPVNTLQESLTEPESDSAFDRDERVSPVSSLKALQIAPAETVQFPAHDTMRAATDKADAPSQRQQSFDSAREENDKPSQAAAGGAHERERIRDAPGEPSLPTRPAKKPFQSPLSPTLPDTHAVTRDAQGTPSAQTVLRPERERVEPPVLDEKSAGHASLPSLKEAPDKRDDSSLKRSNLSEPVHVIERVTERIISTVEPPSHLKSEASITSGVAREKPASHLVEPEVSRVVEVNGTDSTQQTRAAESEPVIQVTIGRIEVRAAAQPSEAKAGRGNARSSTQSLEEYLNKRAQRGGSR